MRPNDEAKARGICIGCKVIADTDSGGDIPFTVESFDADGDPVGTNDDGDAVYEYAYLCTVVPTPTKDQTMTTTFEQTVAALRTYAKALFEHSEIEGFCHADECDIRVLVRVGKAQLRLTAAHSAHGREFRMSDISGSLSPEYLGKLSDTLLLARVWLHDAEEKLAAY
jgi:hypothetical protein